MAVGSTFFWHSSVTVPWYLNGGSRAMMPCKFRAWHHAAMHGPSFSQKNNGSGSEPWVLPAGNLNASTTREYRHFTISQNACCLSSCGQKHGPQKHGPSPFWRNDHIVTYILWLVGGLEHLDYVSIQLGSSSSQLLLSPSFFRGGGSTTNHGQVLKPTHGDLANLAR